VLLIQLLVARVKRGRRRYKGPEAPVKLTKAEFKVRSSRIENQACIKTF
jgi:hypothetical protein